MKRLLIAALIAALPLAAFAQDKPARPEFPGHLNWKAGTSVTAEYQELTGTIALGERVVPVFKVKNVDYLLLVRPKDPAALLLKNGATVAFKGVATKIVESGKPDKYLFKPTEATIDGQAVKFERMGMGMHRKWHPEGPGMGPKGPGPQGGTAQ